jgi:hypothetical protein
MLTRKFILIAAGASFLFGTVSSQAQESGALLDLLVRKKIITDQEAEEVRAELTKEYASAAAGKWKLSAPITELELYGDARLRYEVRQGQNVTQDTQQRNRHRYRLRLGLRGTLMDDWFFGLRMESSASARSANVTFGDESSGGPFSKSSDAVHWSQVYVGYRGFRDITLTVGRMQNPIITTPMVWDADINPEGLAEQYKHSFTFNFGGGGSTTATEGYSKDGKAMAATTSPVGEPWQLKVDLFANFGQFVYDDVNPENPFGSRPVTGGRVVPNTDAYLLAWQVGARFNFPKNFYAQIAPTLYNYTGNGDNFNVFFDGDSAAANNVGINDLLVFEVPMEVGWKLGELPMRIFGDFAINLDGEDRAFRAGNPEEDDNVHAYTIGLGIGQLKVKRDWQIDVFWQHTEQYALDPNLVDSDIFDSRLGLEGLAIKAGYALSDAVTLNLTYAYGWRIDDDIGTGGAGDIGTNPVDDYQIFQADLNLKF